MLDTVQGWHQRYLLQTHWTHALARYLFQSAGISSSDSILEVGCGTGAVLQEILQPLHNRCFGLDINPNYISFAALTQPPSRLILGDAHQLPLADACIDVCLCHFFLLWVTNPARVLLEMGRITHPGGVVMALAEPDYGSRIDYPQELSILGEWQRESLLRQGADPLFGRKLRSIFSSSGLVDVEAGLLGGEWKMSNIVEQESEWDVLRTDLANDPDKIRKLDDLVEIDSNAWERGARVLYVPTFYAWGRVPK